ncbi:glutamate racemase [Cohnella faecalis]|uniref:Glutamate racemase n=1 Tax=Cohnella faecalis TaxID=2315694 RepID=A0A398CTN9_9BACL|nr:glutamate racemase [Cohnella faecalis]RIE03227.1 glutamate racemase [Cohnella faecalis]
MQRAIAVLDSGVGGLTVVKEVMRQLPREKIIYFGDTARAPYGPRAAEEVLAFTREIVDYLSQYKPKMIVIACNTATAVALQDIRARVRIPVIGVINPGARAAIGKSKTGKIGVIGTDGTIKSRAYDHALRCLSPRVEIVSLACPKLVPLVEDGDFHSEETRSIVVESLEALRGVPMDCLILGCTHYPFLSEMISSYMGESVHLISSADETAREISTILHENNQLAGRDERPIHQFFCSGEPRKFQEIAQAWLGAQIRLSPVVWHIPHNGSSYRNGNGRTPI